jgi:hypothetical protein
MGELDLSSNSSMTPGTQLQLIHDTSRQQDWVNITRCCKYRQVLLMMGENIAGNM